MICPDLAYIKTILRLIILDYISILDNIFDKECLEIIVLYDTYNCQNLKLLKLYAMKNIRITLVMVCFLVAGKSYAQDFVYTPKKSGIRRKSL